MKEEESHHAICLGSINIETQQLHLNIAIC